MKANDIVKLVDPQHLEVLSMELKHNKLTVKKHDTVVEELEATEPIKRNMLHLIRVLSINCHNKEIKYLDVDSDQLVDFSMNIYDKPVQNKHPLVQTVPKLKMQIGLNRKNKYHKITYDGVILPSYVSYTLLVFLAVLHDFVHSNIDNWKFMKHLYKIYKNNSTKDDDKEL